ncbi:hypothetical protein PINS_up001650 [Pythium insidiosum]|nr:hypothetical protein PINS_up001650 [Pythium insidiosum]
MAGLGVITLEQVYPIVIGANLGTTGTALLASMVTGQSDSVAIALVHFWFNVWGIFLFYPIPATRAPIYNWARALACFSACWPMSAVLFLVVLFLIAPGILLLLTYMCSSTVVAARVFGWLLAIVAAAASGLLLFWYHRRGGRERWHAFLEYKAALRERLASRSDTTPSHGDAV